MPSEIDAARDEGENTQLHAIRELMFSAAQRGTWMTLDEIAKLTEIGEASISAQLRHLRKRRHGRHRVEKRLRRVRPIAAGSAHTQRGTGRRGVRMATKWEYRVLPPTRRNTFAGARTHGR